MPTTPSTLLDKKRKGRPIACLTAYDHPTAVLVDRAGADLILVGDSLGVMLLGHRSPEETTMEEMILHGRSVARGARDAMVVVDMPFGSYEVSAPEAARNAIRLVKETGAQAVKVEGGMAVLRAVEAMAAIPVTVVGHLGRGHLGHLAPDQAVDVAAALEGAGARAVVLVEVENALARRIREALEIPVIGYGSGPGLDGQLMVTPRLLGLLPADRPAPGPYGHLGRELQEAFVRFVRDVAEGVFPPS